MNIKKKNINNNINNNNNSFYKNIYSEEKGILELTLQDFDNIDNKLYIKNKYFDDKKGFIIFYAPWCKHCNEISDLLVDLALSNINIFNFGAVNSENINEGNYKVCIYENISKFPTIKYINDDGTLTNYENKYTIDNLLYFININV